MPISRFFKERSAVLVLDMQEKLLPQILDADREGSNEYYSKALKELGEEAADEEEAACADVGDAVALEDQADHELQVVPLVADSQWQRCLGEYGRGHAQVQSVV